MKKSIITKIALGVYCVIALFVVSANMPMDSWNFPNFQAEGQEQVPGVSMAFARYNSLYHPFSDLYNGLIAPMEGYIYVIENAQDLYRFSMECNGSDSQTYLGLDYVLGNDIDFLSEVYQERYFRPVGFLPNPNYDAEKTDLENEAANVLAFQGTFDGQGFEISNLMLEPIMDSTVFQNVFQSNLRYYSMFSIVGENGIIKNLGLIDPVLRQFLDFYQKIEYASVLAGANHGHIDHVYVIDKRPGTTSGHIVSETIRLSGIISVNYHSFNEAFVSALRINASGITPASTRVVLDENAGEAISNVYYDSTVYLNQSPDLAEPVPHDTETIDFQDSSFFDASWFFNNSYLPANNPNNIYPILKGFTREDAFLDIDSAADLVYLSKMMDKSLGFQDLSYRIAGDIDMAMVSRTVYQTPVTPFSGVLAGRLTSTDVSKIRYTREIGDNDFFTILNLSMTKGTDLGTFVGYGLFGILTGTVQNLNIFGTILSMNDHETFVENENFLAAGVVASHLKGGSINTVLIETETTLPAGEMNKVFIGGFVGLGNGTITASASEGLIVGGTHSFVPKSKDSALGGFIGYAGVPGETGIYLTLTSSTNGIDIIGPGFSGTPDSLVSLGGFVGSGSMNPMTNLVNNGNLFSHAPGTAIASVFMGGVIGYQIMMANNTTNNIINNGDLTLVVNRQTQARLAAGYGVGANQLSTSSRTYTNLTNYGHILFDIPSEKVFTEAELRGMDIQIAGILIGYYFASTLNRLINNADLSIDLSLVQACAGLVIANNNYYNGSTEPDYRWKYNDLGDKVSGTISLYRSYNAGLITAITSNPVYAKQIKIAGVVLGKSINMYSLRNENEIKVTISHDSPDALESASPSDGLLKQEKNIIIVGVAEEVSSGRRGSELYNGGNLSFFSEKTKDIKFHLFLSGVVHRTKNVTITTTGNIVKTLLNDGYLFVDAGLTGDIRVSGIANTVAGAVQSAINTGDLFVKNEMKPTETDDYLLDAAGISTLMIGNSLTTSFLANVLNYGDIVAYSSTANGRALAAGILARNNRREDFTNRTSNSTYKYINAAIRNSINYGNVYAWNERSETAGTVERPQVEKEVFAIAAGVLGYGMLRIENVINYGDIYSKTLAGGIVGHLDKYSFARFYSTAEFTLANLVNYGSIRQITEAGAFSFDSVTGIGQHPAFINSAFIRSGSTAFGGILGNIYVGDQTWNFSTGYYAVSPDTWRHWLNFDQVSDVVGNQPGPDGMDEVLAGMLVSNLYAVKLKDDSLYPFLNIRSFSLDDAPLTLDDGVDGTTYSGVFDSSFAFKNPPESTPPILNNIQFIPIERVNAVLSAKICQLFLRGSREFMLWDLRPESENKDYIFRTNSRWTI